MIEKILKHLGLWDLKVKPPPKVKVPSVTISIDYSDSHVPLIYQIKPTAPLLKAFFCITLES